MPVLVERLLSKGVTGLYTTGSTGEGMHMTAAERKAMLEAVVAAVKGRVPVMAMVGAWCVPRSKRARPVCQQGRTAAHHIVPAHSPLDEAVDLAQHAERTGAAAISAVCPGTYAWTGEQPVGLAGCASFWKRDPELVARSNTAKVVNGVTSRDTRISS